MRTFYHISHKDHKCPPQKSRPVDIREFLVPTMKRGRRRASSDLHLEVRLSSSLPADGDWRRSSRCNGGSCVEVLVRDSVVLVRSSADPDSAMLAVRHEEWRTWVSKVRDAHQNP
jgi:hypothetical protein